MVVYYHIQCNIPTGEVVFPQNRGRGKQLESESQAERKYRKTTQKRRLVDSKDTKASDFFQRAQMYEKLIYQNPQFIPRDSFNEIFNIIKCKYNITI